MNLNERLVIICVTICFIAVTISITAYNIMALYFK
jgi:cytochrome c-type biogenesis protein CcmE